MSEHLPVGDLPHLRIETEAGRELWSYMNNHYGSSVWGRVGDGVLAVEAEMRERLAEVLEAGDRMSEKIRAAAEKSTRDSFAMTVYSDGVRDGVRAERERIIALLEVELDERPNTAGSLAWNRCLHKSIALIKGETE